MKFINNTFFSDGFLRAGHPYAQKKKLTWQYWLFEMSLTKAIDHLPVFTYILINYFIKRKAYNYKVSHGGNALAWSWLIAYPLVNDSPSKKLYVFHL